jgi:hypothetical protein
MPSRPLVRSHARCFALLVAFAGLGAAHADATNKVRVTYRAPPECPDETAFLSAVRARVGTEWEAAPGEMARAFEVTVSLTPERPTASIDFVDAGGRHLSRKVSAGTCPEVVAGIALVTALAIESRTTEGAESNEAGSAGEAAPSTAPSAATNAPPAPSRAVAATPALAPATGSHPAPREWHGDITAAGVVSSGVGPAPAFGARLSGGLGWKSGPDVRVAIDYLATPETTVDDYGGVKLQSSLFGGRASACPFAFPLWPDARVLPCAGLAAGIIHAETRPSAGLQSTGSGTLGFFAPLAELRADAAFGTFFVEATGEVRFVLNKPTFALDPPHDERPLYRVPLASVGGSVGLGLRL